MKGSDHWKQFWDNKGNPDLSDFEFDRGRDVRDPRIENLAKQELLEFIDPRVHEVVLDAGCGTGSTTLLLQSSVNRVIAMDYSESSMTRCSRRFVDQNVPNVALLRGDLSHIPLRARSVNKIVCLSVLQFLDDEEVRRALIEAHRILTEEGIIVLHVKNLSSIYLSTLWLFKRVKRALGLASRREHVRHFTWYLRELESLRFKILDYNSFGLLSIEGMPRRLSDWMRRTEFRHHRTFPLCTRFLRRHGPDLKIKATIMRPSEGGNPCRGSLV